MRRQEESGTQAWRRRPLLQSVVVVWLLGLVIALTTSAQASASGCPNEALRSELYSGHLPDCRAYELVSSGYKESAVISSVFAISPEGERVIGNSFGVFGGAQGDGLGQGTSLLGSTYLFSRYEGAGWAATALDPPSSVFMSNGMFDTSADLGGTLWELGKRRVSPPGAVPEEASCPPEGGEEAQLEGVTDLYLEQPVGIFTRIGPATPAPCTVNANRYLYLGASADLSRVLFSTSSGFRWPFDGTATGSGTLYEYAGVGHSEPFLVGVMGSLGSSALVSRCGTRLGSSAPEESIKGSMYNAISASGTRIFFTAVGADEPGCNGEAPPVDELFAREEDPAVAGELPSREWRTVPVSEPSREECNACLTSSGLRDAVFQGASEDGSKVFFTTEQELLPGATGENLYEYDFDAPLGERVVLVSGGPVNAGVQGVARVSEDGTHVYFVAKGALTGTSTNIVGNSAEEGENNLYVYERDAQAPAGRTSFVATLAPTDSGDWQPADERPVLASHDGHLLVFSSGANLTGEGLTVGRAQVFQYDATTDGLVRASIGQGGFNDNDRLPVEGSSIRGTYSFTRVDSPASANGGQAAEDGAVFFQSPDALTPQALNDQPDSKGDAVPNIYEYRTGSVYLLSDGRDVSTLDTVPGISLVGSDASGADVFFFTSDSLIPGDGDTQQDLYDVRVDGGLPPASALTTSCTGEACRGPLAGAPALAPLGGSAIQAAETASVAPPTVPAKPKPVVKKKPRAKHKRKARSGKKANKAKHSHASRATRLRSSRAIR